MAEMPSRAEEGWKQQHNREVFIKAYKTDMLLLQRSRYSISLLHAYTAAGERGSEEGVCARQAKQARRGLAASRNAPSRTSS